MFAIIQGLYVLREDEEEDIERKKITEKTNFQIWISSWRACQTRADITTKKRRQKGKAATDERMANQRKGRTHHLKNGQRRPKETQAERSGASKKKEADDQ